MKLAEGQMVISISEYSKLRELKGRVDGAQDLLNNSGSVYLNDVCNVIGIDMKEYNKRQEENRSKYARSIVEDGVDVDHE